MACTYLWACDVLIDRKPHHCCEGYSSDCFAHAHVGAGRAFPLAGGLLGCKASAAVSLQAHTGDLLTARCQLIRTHVSVCHAAQVSGLLKVSDWNPVLMPTHKAIVASALAASLQHWLCSQPNNCCCRRRALEPSGQDHPAASSQRISLPRQAERGRHHQTPPGYASEPPSACPSPFRPPSVTPERPRTHCCHGHRLFYKTPLS